MHWITNSYLNSTILQGITTINIPYRFGDDRKKNTHVVMSAMCCHDVEGIGSFTTHTQRQAATFIQEKLDQIHTEVRLKKQKRPGIGPKIYNKKWEKQKHMVMGRKTQSVCSPVTYLNQDESMRKWPLYQTDCQDYNACWCKIVVKSRLTYWN